MKRWLIVLSGILPLGSTAQYWDQLGRGPIGNGNIQTIFGDSVSGRLLAGGPIDRVKNDADTVLGMGQFAWDGNRWDSLAHRIQVGGGQQTYWFLRYQGDLYCCGGFTMDLGNGVGNTRIARLNETTVTWEPLECLNAVLSGLSQLVMRRPQEHLYLTGYSSSICDYPQASVFRYDGSAFYEWPPFQAVAPDDDNYVGSVFDFQGYTYMSGLYWDPIGSGLAGFRRFDGTNWEAVPGWNTTLPIKDIFIRNDTLYVAGAFTLAGGGPGNYVAYFDGQQWNDMAGGMSLPVAPNSAAVTDLEWHNGRLYASGTFTHASGVFMNGGLAWWDGAQWCGFPELYEHEPGDQDPLTAPTVTDMAIWRDTLYITGSYRNTDMVTVKQVAKWIGGGASTNCEDTSGEEDHTPPTGLLIAPNPSGDWITLTAQQAIDVFVFDALSRQVWQGRVQGSMNVVVSDWEPGTYFVRHGAGTNKLVVVR